MQIVPCKAGLTLNDLYDTTRITHNSTFKFLWRLSYKLFIPSSFQVFKQIDSRTIPA